MKINEVKQLTNNAIIISLKDDSNGNMARYLVSYETVVAGWETWETGEGIVLDPKWEYSRTTMKHVNWFLGCNAQEIRKKIKSGAYKVKNLNE